MGTKAFKMQVSFLFVLLVHFYMCVCVCVCVVFCSGAQSREVD